VGTATADVRLVSLCDKVHNARSILADVRRDGLAAFDKFRGGLHGTIWYYRSLAEAFGKAASPLNEPFLEELDRTVTEIERLTGVNGREVEPKMKADKRR
jgi:hypothetical protein